ncbi:MAG: ImmA/IrrE family metallo-endopeptidase [Flavobacteriales bacterium]|nr:ImmA/IrrE family metallo-endopeptidase [Flavobacteriales bacterium]
MNTLEKGDDFEERALEIIKDSIQKGSLGLRSDCIKIYNRKQKSYYSHLRKSNIHFDLSIEVWPPNSERFTLLYLIECKNYAKRVPVDDLEEFHSKIRQVLNQGAFIKGVFISNAPLQKGAREIAKSTNMMVIQGETVDNYKILLHKTNRKLLNQPLPTISNNNDEPNLDDDIREIVAHIDFLISNSFTDTSQEYRTDYNLDRLSKAQIEVIANRELDQLDPRILVQGFAVTRVRIRKYLHDFHGVTFKRLKPSSELLGICDIERNTIALHPSIIDTERETFIVAHEFGHLLLHQKLRISQDLYDHFTDSEFSFSTEKYALKNAKNWIEWQANYFATCLLLPKQQFTALLYKAQKWAERKNGRIYLDDQYDNIQGYEKVVSRLAYLTQTSKTTVRFRLHELKLVENHSKLKSISQIIKEFGTEIFV